MYERDVKADRQVWGRRAQECDLELSPPWPVGAVSPMWRWSKQAIQGNRPGPPHSCVCVCVWLHVLLLSLVFSFTLII